MYLFGQVKGIERLGMRKAVNRISTILLIIVLLLTLILFGARVIGFKPYAVLSGSMTPEYPVGSIVYTKHCEPNEIREGDVITFMKNETTVVTHRVVSVEDNDNGLCFVTKGDANADNDAGAVHEKNVIGKVAFSIPLLGYLSNYISTTPGCYIAGIVVLIILFLAFVPDLLFAKEDKKGKKEGKEE